MEDSLDYRSIGSRVRRLRMQHKLTQEYLAELVGVSSSFIGHIERGEKKSSLETMSRLAKMLGTTLDYLVFGIMNRCDQQYCKMYRDLKKTLECYGNNICFRREGFNL